MEFITIVVTITNPKGMEVKYIQKIDTELYTLTHALEMPGETMGRAMLLERESREIIKLAAQEFAELSY